MFYFYFFYLSPFRFKLTWDCTFLSSFSQNRSVSPSVISAAERICVQGLFLHSKNHSSTSAVLRCVMSIRRECGFLLSEVCNVCFFFVYSFGFYPSLHTTSKVIQSKINGN